MSAKPEVTISSCDQVDIDNSTIHLTVKWTFKPIEYIIYTFMLTPTEYSQFLDKQSECNCTSKDMLTFGHRKECGRLAPIDKK